MTVADLTLTVRTSQGARQVTFDERTQVGTALTEVALTVGHPRRADMILVRLPRGGGPSRPRTLDDTDTLRQAGLRDEDVLLMRPENPGHGGGSP